MTMVSPVAGRPLLIAHRGAQVERAEAMDTPAGPAYRIYPENSVAALVRAAELGTAGVELDVIATQDGVLKVHHDDATGRVFRMPDGAERLVKDMTAAEADQAVYHPPGVLQTIAPKLADIPQAQLLLEPPDPDNPPEVPQKVQMPTLASVIDAVLKAKPDMQFFVELKTTQDPPYPCETNQAEERLVALVQQKNLFDRVTVISFNPWSLLKLKHLEPRLKTGLDLVVQQYQPHIGLQGLMSWAKQVLQVDTVLPPYKEATAAFVSAAKAVGLKVMPWVWKETCHQELAEADRLSALGVDGLVTNAPQLIQSHWQYGATLP